MNAKQRLLFKPRLLSANNHVASVRTVKSVSSINTNVFNPPVRTHVLERVNPTPSIIQQIEQVHHSSPVFKPSIKEKAKKQKAVEIIDFKTNMKRVFELARIDVL